MSSHLAHDRNEQGLPLLCDDCPRCVEQAEDLGIHLDEEKWARAWSLMLAVELNQGNGPDSYLSGADKKLGHSLYMAFVVLQRNTLIDPTRLPLRYA